MSLRRSARSNKGTNKYLEALLKEEQEEGKGQKYARTETANDDDLDFKVEESGNYKDDDFIDDDDEDNEFGKRRRSLQTKIGTKVKSKNDGNASKKAKKDVKNLEKDFRLRQNAKKMFLDLFSKFIIPDTVNANLYEVPKEKSQTDVAESFSESLEQELFKSCFQKDPDQLTRFYPEKVRVLYSNLKDVKNLTLKNHVINGNIPLEKLVSMNANELANPDLQHFKEEIDSKLLTQLVVEAPNEKPRWIKTHKGEELIETQDEFKPENDVIYERGNIINHEPDNETEVEQITHEAETNPKVETHQEQTPLEDEERSTGLKNDNFECTEDLRSVIVSYPEFENEFSGDITYLGASKLFSNTPVAAALGDGKLSVEGRLSKGRVLSYLTEMKSTRLFLFYSITPATAEALSKDSFNWLHQFLTNNEKIIGIKTKKDYEKNIYLMPTEFFGESHTMSSILNPDISQELHKNDSKLCILVVIKPEMLNRG